MPRTKKKLSIFTWSLILLKIQDGGQDGDHFWWRHRPPAAPPPIKYTSFFGEDQWLSTEGKIFSKHCNISKTLGRGSINPPSPPPQCITVGVWPCAYVREFKKKNTHTTRKKHTHPQTEQYVRTPQLKSEQTTVVLAILRNTLFSYPCFPLTPRHLKTEIYYDWRFTQFTHLR